MLGASDVGMLVTTILRARVALVAPTWLVCSVVRPGRIEE